jgi:hypothetical protein
MMSSSGGDSLRQAADLTLSGNAASSFVAIILSPSRRWSSTESVRKTVAASRRMRSAAQRGVLRVRVWGLPPRGGNRGSVRVETCEASVLECTLDAMAASRRMRFEHSFVRSA